MLIIITLLKLWINNKQGIFSRQKNESSSRKRKIQIYNEKVRLHAHELLAGLYGHHIKHTSQLQRLYGKKSK